MMANAFNRLHRDIQHALWDMQWETLRGFQANAIHAWFDNSNDIVLMANTAAGKTEAAFLPILSSLADESESGSVQVLYIGPLKALINDQFRRIEELCSRSGIDVHRWHGDVPGSKKKALVKKPSGILLITPESLESLFIRKGRELSGVFGGLRAIVIDEMHVFLDSERGRQLRSQLSRIDRLIGRQEGVRRIGLSATIGSREASQEWIQRKTGVDPIVIESQGSRAVELLLKTFVEKPAGPDSEGAQSDQSDGLGLLSVAQHILETLYGNTNLVFCNRKTDIEILADTLGRLCKRRRLENQYIVHHGSLSKAIREEAEAELQSGRPCTAICSSTLELGIDVGDVDAVGQVGPPHSVSAMKQRLGRSGRRGDNPSRLFLYTPVIRCDHRSGLPDTLYPDLLQAIALVELMIGKRDESGQGWIEPKWVEPPISPEYDYSTLIQQMLSTVAQLGAGLAESLYKALCVDGAFDKVSTDDFMTILRDLGKRDMLEQTNDGQLILGLIGERLVKHYDFYAAFNSPDQYQVSSNAGQVGTVETEKGFYQPGQFMLLAGKRWKVTVVDEERKTISVEPAKGMQLTRWAGSGGAIHERVREKMRQVLVSDSVPNWLESTSKEVLEWSRMEASHYDLDQSRVIEDQNGLHLFTWTGTRQNHTLCLLFIAAGVSFHEVSDEGICISISVPDIQKQDVLALLSEYCDNPLPPEAIVKYAFRRDIPPVGKHGEFLSYDLLAKAYAGTHLDPEGAICAARTILDSEKVSNKSDSGRLAMPKEPPLIQAKPTHPVIWVESDGQLAECCRALQVEKLIALDVETHGKNQELCLIQVATAKQTFIIDPLAIQGITKLKEVFENQDTKILIHNAEFEQSVLGKHGIRLNGVVDTLELARSSLPLPKNDLATVCEHLLGVVVDKACQRSDWRRRPLASGQLEYAALDAEILMAVYAGLQVAPDEKRIANTAQLER